MTSELGIAVHALVYLNHKADILSSEELADNICTNPARVRKIMAKLKRAGILHTKEGAEGGYSFTGDPSAVTLRQVGDALGMRFVAASWRSGDPGRECHVASGMADVMDGIYQALDEMCNKHLETITIQDIIGKIFSR